MCSCKICKQKSVLVEKVEGYKRGVFYNIYYCENCNTSFTNSHEDDSKIYDLIYKNSHKIKGYSRYEKYKSDVIKANNPIEYLSEQEDMYWAVYKSIEMGVFNKSSKVLEVGSGLGYLTYALHKSGFNIKGCDISETAVEKARIKFNNNLIFFVADIYKLSENATEKFDTIILTEVIEHITNPISFLEALLKLLNKNGKLIITTPNKSSYPNSIYWTSDLPPVHYWFFSEQAFKNIAIHFKLEISFINFQEYNQKKHAYVNPEKVVIGTSTFDINNKLIKEENKFLLRVKSLVKKMSLYKMYRSYQYKNNIKGADRSYVLCCILNK